MVNGAWIASCSREQRRFVVALGRVEETQKRYLLNLLRRNAGSRFGEQHGFSKISSVAEFQARVPSSSYETIKTHIDAIARGETNILTADPVTRFQPTSGSTSGTKFIPWTRSVAREFRRGIAPWMAALYTRQPALLSGTAYWSISPPSTLLQTHGQMRVGFDHDAGYLGFLGQKVFSLVNSVPPSVAQCVDATEFRTRTLLSLLADEDLCLISVWSPTFLTTLLEDFLVRQEFIINALAKAGGPRAKRRAEFLRTVTSASKDADLFEQVWPNLKVISCWTHGPSELYAQNLRRLFPTVEIQGKGLVATEAFVSLPFRDGDDPVLAATSHFFEFEDPHSNTIFLAHELVRGNEYRVLVTTGGGLYRYPLGDRVRVTGFIQDAPCLRFIGREHLVSDLFGEKLHGTFVESVIRRVFAQQGIQPRFFLVAPVDDAGARTGYALFLDAATIPDPKLLCHNLETGLAENFHYALCRRLGQLSQARLFHIHHNSISAATVFTQEMLSRGLRPGDVKMVPLDRQLGWEQRFHGQFAA
jgi:hypothetical protein